jgi:hypothetical protein
MWHQNCDKKILSVGYLKKGIVVLVTLMVALLFAITACKKKATVVPIVW